MAQIFRRKIYQKMLDWKRISDGKSALLIQGARRIGKSTIVEEFARREYKDYLIIDFSTAEPIITELFNHISNIDTFFFELQTVIGRTLPRHESVIVFDEVQMCPKARQAIKHLVNDGRYDYIETGSLISISKNIKGIVIPSEETCISMYPLDFEEFLWAIGKEATFEYIVDCFNKLKPLGDAVHRAIMRDFRLYMLVGGMPQAVVSYIESNDFAVVDQTKRNILNLYSFDFRRIDPKGRATTLFNSIPGELSHNSSRYKVSNVISGARPSRMGEIFADIADSMAVNFAYHADDPNVGFALHADYNYFKMYLADTGLFITLAFKDRDYTDNEIYRKLLFDKLPTDLGYIYENVVAQMLKAAGHSLFYHTFSIQASDTSRPTNYELDFLITHRDKICPIEVKSSNYKAHKSLDLFVQKHHSRIGQSYLLYTKDLDRKQNTVYLPVYMAGLL